jgi:CRP-like cAMP-binding protein
LSVSTHPAAGMMAGAPTGGISSAGDGDAAWSQAHANFLSSLSPDETRDLLSCARRILLKPREHLFRAGDQSNDVYIVAEGCVRLFQVTPTGKETILWINFPGELFGMAEIWSGESRQVYAVANDATRIHSIRRQDFIKFLGAHPEAAMKAIGILSARVRALGHTLGGLASDNVETRIARLLMRFAAISSTSRCAIASGELCVNVRLRHQDIANLVGASRQTVTTTLLDLRRQGTIRIVNHHIHIVRSEDLRNLLGLNPDTTQSRDQK